jgi:hypothetical protein
MTTFSDLVEKTSRRLLSGVMEQTVQLIGDYTAGASTLTVVGGFSGAIQAGARLSIDLEVFYVTSTTTAGTLGVIGGYEGSTPANHASGSQIHINPRFSKFDIGVAINDDLLDLSSPINGLGQVGAIDVTYIPVYAGYDLGSGFDGASSKVLEVSWKTVPPTRTYPLMRRGQWRVIRNQSDTSAFPSGNGIIVYDSAQPGFPIRVQYLSPFAPLVNLTDDITTVAGIPNTMADIPPLGAAIQLMQPREIKRNFFESQPDPRKAPEIPPNSVANSFAKLEQQRQKRIDAECDRIMRAYPEAEGF